MWGTIYGKAFGATLVTNELPIADWMIQRQSCNLLTYFKWLQGKEERLTDRVLHQ